MEYSRESLILLRIAWFDQWQCGIQPSNHAEEATCCGAATVQSHRCGAAAGNAYTSHKLKMPTLVDTRTQARMYIRIRSALMAAHSQTSALTYDTITAAANNTHTHCYWKMLARVHTAHTITAHTPGFTHTSTHPRAVRKGLTRALVDNLRYRRPHRPQITSRKRGRRVAGDVSARLPSSGPGNHPRTTSSTSTCGVCDKIHPRYPTTPPTGCEAGVIKTNPKYNSHRRGPKKGGGAQSKTSKARCRALKSLKTLKPSKCLKSEGPPPPISNISKVSEFSKISEPGA